MLQYSMLQYSMLVWLILSTSSSLVWLHYQIHFILTAFGLAERAGLVWFHWKTCFFLLIALPVPVDGLSGWFGLAKAFYLVWSYRFLLDFKREFDYSSVYLVWETIWAAERYRVIIQCWGSKYIEFGSGSRILALKLRTSCHLKKCLISRVSELLIYILNLTSFASILTYICMCTCTD